MIVTDDMVNRFLTWWLPTSVYPDGKPGDPSRTGTNLLNAGEARAMLEHVLSDIPPVVSRPPDLAEAARRVLAEYWHGPSKKYAAALADLKAAVEAPPKMELPELRKEWAADERKAGRICVGCDGCGWCEGSPAFKCERCNGAGIVDDAPKVGDQ